MPPMPPVPPPATNWMRDCTRTPRSSTEEDPFRLSPLPPPQLPHPSPPSAVFVPAPPLQCPYSDNGETRESAVCLFVARHCPTRKAGHFLALGGGRVRSGESKRERGAGKKTIKRRGKRGMENEEIW
jgi:hypothetical protein